MIGRQRLRHALVAGAVVVGLGWVAVVATALWREHEEAVEAAGAKTQNLTRLLEEHTRQTLFRAEASLRLAATALVERGSAGPATGSGIRQRLLALMTADGLIANFVLIDRDGTIVLTTAAANTNTNGLPSVADRDYFIAHRERSGLGMVIGATIKSRVTGEWITPLSLRLDTAAGEFDGVLSATLAPAYFQNFYDAIDTGGNGFVTLFNRPGWILARSPFSERIFSRNWADSPMFRDHLPGAAEKTVRQVDAADGIERIYSYRALNDYPVVVSLGLSMTDSLAPWRGQLWRQGLFVLLALGALGAMTWALVRQLRLAEAIETERRHEQEAVTITLLSIADAVIATDVAGLVTRMNPAAERLTGWPLAEARGRPLAEVFCIVNALTRLPGVDPVQQVLESGRAVALANHIALVTREGHEVQIADSAAPIRDAAGAIQGVVLVFSDVSEKYRVEQALRASEQHFEAMARAMSDIVYRMSADWSLMHPLDGRALVASNDVPLAGWAWLDQNIPADERARVRQAIGVAIAQKAFFSLEHRVLRPDGSIGWTASRAVPILDAHGNVREWFGAASDITARKEAEAALARSEAFTRSVVGASADCMNSLSLDGRLMWMNDSGQRLMELRDFAALRGTDYSSFWETGGLRAQAEAAMATARAGGTGRFTGFCPTFAGTPRWWDVAVTAIPGQDGRAEQLLAVSRDVTEQRAADEATRGLAQRLQLALDSSGVVLFQQDLDLRYTWIYNPVLGFKASQVVGKFDADLMEVAADAEAVTARKRDVLLTGVGQRHEVVIHHQGVAHCFRLLIEPLRDAAGTVSGVTCAAIDITELKRAELTLQASLREKEALLKEVHHRVKNNLQVVSSLLRLEAGRSGHAPTKAVLAEMQGRIRAMALLHESVYRSGTFAAIDLGAYLKQVATQALRSLQTSAAPAQPRLRLALGSVPVGLDQATPCGLLLTELVSNALKHAFTAGAAGAAGEVCIELQPVPGGVADLWCLRVSDNGVGLPADFAARQQDSLGLQLVASLAHQLGGRLVIGAEGAAAAAPESAGAAPLAAPSGAVFSVTFAVTAPTPLAITA